MQMQNRDIDNIREKLYNLEVAPGPELWNGVAATMRRRRLRRLALYVSSAAAVLVAALLLVTADPEKQHDTLELAVVQQVQDPGQTSSKTVQPAIGQDAQQTPAVVQTVRKVSAKGNVPQGGALSAEVVAEDVVAAEPDSIGQELVMAEPQTAADEKDEVPRAANVKETYIYPHNSEMGYIADADYSRGKRRALAVTSNVRPGSSAAVASSYMRASAAGAEGISGSWSIEQISDTRYSLPLNVGVQVQFPVGENMAIGVGVDYTMLGSSYNCLINKKNYEVEQTLHYIGVPINVYGIMAERNRFSFYLNAGIAIEKGIRAVYDLKSYSGTTHSSSDISGLEFSANAGMGVEYRIIDIMGLYFEPNLVYYPNSDVPRSIRTDQPLQVNAELGFRFRF